MTENGIKRYLKYLFYGRGIKYAAPGELKNVFKYYSKNSVSKSKGLTINQSIRWCGKNNIDNSF